MKKLSKEDAQKRLSIIVSVAVAIAVLSVGIYALSIMFKSNSKTPTGTVQLVSNPSIMMVLNSSDKVIDVVYGNKDGETLLANTDLLGKSVNEASVMFAKLCSKAGFIDVTNESSGTKVEVYVTHINGKKVDKLKNTIVKSMNGYFDENGIIAGAVCNGMNSLKVYAESLGTNINKYIMIQTALALNSQYNENELLALKEKRLMKHIKFLMDNTLDLSYDNYVAYSDLINDKIAELEIFMQEKLEPVYEIVEDIHFDYDLNLTIPDLKMQVEDMDLTNNEKESINNILDTLKNVVDKKVKELNNEMKKEKEDFIKNSEDDKAQAKLLLKNKIASYQNTVNSSLDYFLDNKEELKQKIKDYRESIS